MKKYTKPILFTFAGGAVFAAVIFSSAYISSPDDVYTKKNNETIVENSASVSGASGDINDFKKQPPPPLYLPTPEPLKAIYMTSWVAGTSKWREDIIHFIETSEINALVIDVKDYTGRVAFDADDEVIKESGSVEERIPDIREFLRMLADRGIYTIARISVFQDPYMVAKRPDLAVKTKTGTVWKDRKGISWIDPAAKEYWDYTVRIAKATHAVGFDELNFDYVRFPSDGDMKNIAYDFWDDMAISQAEVLENFFAYLAHELDEIGIPRSVDLFGMTTSNYDDLNIGQVLERAEPYFDYIAPMVYPSHYPPTFIGLANPAAHPYEVIHYAMTRGYARLLKASSTPLKLRPWIQDFDLGATYDASMILKEKQAIYDSGLTSWMAWDPSNKYTREAYSE